MGDGVLRETCRSKKFQSFHSLLYEKERLDTFIEWPAPWVSPKDLAADGFYYLRTKDHCACVFCRGIIGSWRVGDTPRNEHARHFSHCPFVRGLPSGNVPLTHCAILEKLDGKECPMPKPRSFYATVEPRSGRHMPGSYPECEGLVKTENEKKKNNVDYDELGLPRHSGPKRKEYISKERRLDSFDKWPERVLQRPIELAEAGFFYCELSDHVRCYYCGNGLRNWEAEDKPWDEHAKWYPDCNFVVLSKGQKFIDEVKDGESQKLDDSNGKFKPLLDTDLDILMESDVIKATMDVGFDWDKTRLALRQRLEQTGVPFFNLDQCVEAVIGIDTRQLLQKTSSATTAASTENELEKEAEEETNTADEKWKTTEPSSLENDKKTTTTRVKDPIFSSGISKQREEIRECKICMDAEINIVFLPCTHAIACSKCAMNMEHCPICRSHIKYAITPIFS